MALVMFSRSPLKMATVPPRVESCRISMLAKMMFTSTLNSLDTWEISASDTLRVA